MAQASGLAIITGGGRGLGLEFAKSLLRSKLVARAALLDIAGASKAAGELEGSFGPGCAKGWKADVTDLEGLRAVFNSAAAWAREGGHATRVVINNAGIASQGLADSSLAVGINLTAVIEGTNLGYELMKSSGGGTVINVASFGAFVPMPFSPVYAATKSAVVALSRSCAHLANPDSDPRTGGPGRERHGKVHVVALCPAFADTEIVRAPIRAERGDGPFTQVVAMQGGLMTAGRVAAFAVEIVARCREAEEADHDDPCALAGEAVVVLPRAGMVAPPPGFKGDKLSLARPSKL